MFSGQVTGPPSRPTYMLIIPKFTCSVPISIGVPCSRHLTAFFNDSKGPHANMLRLASTFPSQTSASHSPSGLLLSTGSFAQVAAQARNPDSVLILSLLATSNPSSRPAASTCKRIHPHSAQWPPPSSISAKVTVWPPQSQPCPRLIHSPRSCQHNFLKI